MRRDAGKKTKMRQKRPIARRAALALSVFLSLGVFCVPAFAADDDGLADIRSEISSNIQYDESGNEDENATEIKNQIFNYLESYSGWDDAGTMADGYQIISDAVISADESSAYSCASAWKEIFRQAGESLGIQENDNGSETARLEEAGAKINILTWDNTTNSDGTAVDANNAGILYALLKRIDEGIGGTFINTMRGIAIALTIAFGTIGLIQLSMEKSITSEAITREFVKIMAGSWLILNYRFIALMLIYAGQSFIGMMTTSMSNSDSNLVKYAVYQSYAALIKQYNITKVAAYQMSGLISIDTIKNFAMSVVNGIGSVASSGLLAIGNSIIHMASSLVVYALVAEIGVRYLVTPIAIADLYSERFRSTGFMWLKKLFACSLTGVVMYAVVWIITLMKEVMSITYDPITKTVIDLTMVGMLARCRQIANDMVGVH